MIMDFFAQNFHKTIIRMSEIFTWLKLRVLLAFTCNLTSQRKEKNVYKICFD